MSSACVSNVDGKATVSFLSNGVCIPMPLDDYGIVACAGIYTTLNASRSHGIVTGRAYLPMTNGPAHSASNPAEF